MKKEKVFQLGELYCGPGGLGLGACGLNIKSNGRHYRIEHAWANDNDPWACETYAKNLPIKKNHVYCEDVYDFAKRFKTLKKISCLTFGFPCNDFSIVGKKKGLDGEYGSLYSYGCKALDYFQPDWFLAENVGGIRSANEGKTFALILKKLKSAGPGYTLSSGLIKFEDYGIPQRRHRVIIVGINNNLEKKFKFPAPTHIGNWQTCREAIEMPSIIGLPNNELTKQSEKVVERLKFIQPGENAWNSNLPKHLQLNVKKARLSHIYKRLDPNLPSYTITGSGGGGTHVYHWSEPRALTNRERARLQTFPDEFIFEGPKEQVRKQIGMAVPPLAARKIFEAILKTIADIKYDCIENQPQLI